MSEYNKDFIIRFAVIWAILLLGMIFIFSNILNIQSEKEQWLKVGKKQQAKIRVVIPANRGNIYSADNQLMASSTPWYYIYMDTRVPYLHQGGDTAFYRNIDSLAYAFSHYFKDKSKVAYKKEIIKAFKDEKSEHKLYNKMISYSQLKDVKNFPLIRRGRFKSGLITREMYRRVKPYRTLASRTIGDIYADTEKGGKNGLELGFDSILRGEKGVAIRQKIANRRQTIVEVEPINGVDIVTTINIDIQDIAEKALVNKLREINASTGYAIVMEVKTGEIKAIVNMSQTSSGAYAEIRNGAVSDMTEPGSTFKIASLTAVLDDGRASMDDIIDIDYGIWKIHGRTMKDHNAHRGGYGATLTLEQAVNGSSNVGISKTIERAYGEDPAEYVDKLYEMGLNEPFNLYIAGTAKPNIKHPNDKTHYWAKTDLAWMSIGYGTQFAPIYTVAFFNAIANNGRFLEPLLVKKIVKNGKVIKEFKARVIRKQMCKESTVRDVKKALLGVLETPKYATAKSVHSDIVRIAGKTATAQISKGKGGYKSGGKSYQVGFCGFFPYENPKYSCIVVIREPKIGGASGGKMAGPVFKKIAESITAIETKKTVHNMTDLDSTKIAEIPNLKSGNFQSLSYVLNYLDKPLRQENSQTKWAYATKKDNSYTFQSFDIEENKNSMPNIVGMGLKDAIYLCESLGLRVQTKGVGKVFSQSIKVGEKIKSGNKVELTLK